MKNEPWMFHSPASVEGKGNHIVDVQMSFRLGHVIENLVDLDLVQQLPDNGQVVLFARVAEERTGVELEPRERAAVVGFGGFAPVSSVST
jgi:hypothetical protein